jgi:hypothetical protein
MREPTPEAQTAAARQETVGARPSAPWMAVLRSHLPLDDLPKRPKAARNVRLRFLKLPVAAGNFQRFEGEGRMRSERQRATRSGRSPPAVQLARQTRVAIAPNRRVEAPCGPFALPSTHANSEQRATPAAV